MSTTEKSLAAIGFSVELVAGAPLPGRLGELANQYRIPLVQGVRTAGELADLDRSARQETAIVARAGQGGAEKNLVHQIAASQRTTAQVTTVIVPAGIRIDNYDALYQLGITAIIDIGAAANASWQQIQGGLWKAPVAGTLSGVTSWSRTFGAAGAARKIVRQTIASGDSSLLHLAAADLTDNDWGVIESVFRFAAQRSQQGLLQLTTVRQIAARWNRPAQPPVSRSILRAA
ncbi:hypothetical protein [Lignipirellula cremea]|uniref:Uncharacterized protein n=1 Tax=Lignipirellula cremea TaxID=2528010 RepID=A0A518E2Z6_9BACT|nr:hypothetical protein [Lignipirellula cremea]QDU98457.1 hypothetical protein Pla8534_63250 [Lignipirellula cremea]